MILFLKGCEVLHRLFYVLKPFVLLINGIMTIMITMMLISKRKFIPFC